jgi:p-cumate 2,3-dioxygenase beta subunit
MATVISRQQAVSSVLTRAECEDFFIHEASLLDEAHFDDWLALFTPDAVYEVPQAGDPDTVDSSEQLFYISDDYFRLKHRVARMQKQGNHSEWPASVCTRMIGNVRLLGDVASGIAVESKFITHRTKNDVTDAYYGHHRYILRLVDGQIRIASKRTFLDMNSLRQQGKVTIFI